MRYFYDTEFLEDGRTIDLISIGIVADDGREFYAVNEAIGYGELLDRIRGHDWLMDNVIPHLPMREQPRAPGFGDKRLFTLDETSNLIMPPRMIRNAVRDFLLSSDGVELWADYGAYDHVALCQLFGSMIMLPQGLPMFTNEFQQAWRAAGCPPLPEQKGATHNALDDARHLRWCYDVTAEMTQRIRLS
jgi:hypothetical protein